MKKKYIISALFLTLFSNLKAQSTFDWENNTTDNTTTIEQAENGVTCTFTVGTNDPHLYDAGGFAGTNGFVVIGGSNSNTNATFTFSSPINITSIYAAEATNAIPNSATWTFVPTGGSNSTVAATIPEYGNGGVTVNLNWLNITQIEVTSSEATVSYVFDDLIFYSTLSNQEFTMSNSDLNLFPNPSSDYISISGLTDEKNYQVFNCSGNQLLNGSINNNEKIDIQNLSNGLYFLRLNNGTPVKFQKK